MITGNNYIGRQTSAEGSRKLIAFNPANGTAFSETFFEATESEISHAVGKASQAFRQYRALPGVRRAEFLDAIADEIMALGDDLIQRASGESGLPEGRFQGERGRTCNQLKMFASLLREGSWVEATIDTAISDREPIPKPDLRKMQIPIGPVAVFGASNFPLAFSTAGGDTASALAAGCPVIVKGHESHLGTNELVTIAILRAAEKTGMPDGVFSMVNGGIPVGQQLVQHPGIEAVGFTGSLRGGRALFDLASQRPKPIPVYAEMGSINPTFLLPEKLEASAEELGVAFGNSVILGVGQFCTNPGLLIGIKSEALNTFSSGLERTLAESSPATMLNEKIAEGYYHFRDELIDQDGVEVLGSSENPGNNLGKGLTAKVSGDAFLANPKLHEEIFGPFTLLVECKDEEELNLVAKSLEGQLTGTFVATEKDVQNHATLIDTLTQRVGRILFNGVPTGVEVCHSMHHGGPYPASSNPKFTSVGTSAIQRFVRPVVYQNWPESQLPEALKNENSLGIWRLINGNYSNESI